MPALKQTKSSTVNTLNNSDICIKNDHGIQYESGACSDEKGLVGCVIMASGLGKRFGGNKLLAQLGDKPLIKWILDTTEDLLDRRVVVTRSEDIKKMCEQIGVDVIIHNFDGRNDTVRLGLEAIGLDMDYCIFTPADQPFISRDSILQLITTAKSSNKNIVRCAYGDRVGAPICFPQWTFDELLSLPTGKGGNEVVGRYRDRVCNVQVSEEIELDDIDTIEDLERAKKRLEKAKKTSIVNVSML